MPNKYKFTRDWFASWGGRLEPFFKHLPVGGTDEIHILEIGSFEGKSTVWFIENLLNTRDEKSTITCIDPWMNYYQNDNSFESYKPSTKTASGIDYASGDVKKRFIHNINQTGKQNQINIIQGLSHLELPKLFETDLEKYDVIFVDGNHTTPFVLTDGLMSWYLLKKGGVMIFDDYKWEENTKPPTQRPQLAVDSFVKCFGDYLEVLWVSGRYGIRKK